jgi:hypothetical protein
MKLQLFSFAILIVILTTGFGMKSPAKAQHDKDLKIAFIKKETEKKVDVIIDGKLFTSYCWYDNVFRPMLYPVCTSAGTIITRGFPIKPREGEQVDHPHQVGLWLNYGNVNGCDFWDNGESGSRDPKGGEVIHLEIKKMSGGTGEGVLVCRESWIDPSGKELLAENTEYHFIAKSSTRIIDRITTLTTKSDTVFMKDTKEGMYGIRVARQLELPYNGSHTLITAEGKPSTVKSSSNEGVSGNFKSTEGITGDAAWGTRARWMDLYGNIGEEKISLVMCDHPKNPGYPAYWMARGYGLLAANPLGAKDFTKGKKEFNFFIPVGGSATFRYRVVINSGAQLTNAEIDAFADDFAKKYE